MEIHELQKLKNEFSTLMERSFEGAQKITLMRSPIPPEPDSTDTKYSYTIVIDDYTHTFVSEDANVGEYLWDLLITLQPEFPSKVFLVEGVMLRLPLGCIIRLWIGIVLLILLLFRLFGDST